MAPLTRRLAWASSEPAAEVPVQSASGGETLLYLIISIFVRDTQSDHIPRE
jgi:hypothetical protein